MLMNPVAKARRIAHVRSSLVGWSPPMLHGRTTRTRTLTDPSTSFMSKASEGMTFATARIRRAVSRFAAMRIETQQGEEHPGPDGVQGDKGEREPQGDRVENQDDPGASSEVRFHNIARMSNRRKPVST
jgi:hypothetical protein